MRWRQSRNAAQAESGRQRHGRDVVGGDRPERARSAARRAPTIAGTVFTQTRSTPARRPDVVRDERVVPAGDRVQPPGERPDRDLRVVEDADVLAARLEQRPQPEEQEREERVDRDRGRGSACRRVAARLAAATRHTLTRSPKPPSTMRRMTTSVVTGGAGFLGSHLCDYLIEQGHRVICVDNLETGSLENIEHLRGRCLHVRLPGRRRRDLDRRAGRLRLPPREPGEPDRLPAPAAADAQGRLAGHAQRARARQVEARALPDQLDERGLRRPAGASAAGDLLGQRQPDRPARRVRRGQALRRGADDGVPQPAGRQHGDRADLQHLRPADEAQRRARDR